MKYLVMHSHSSGMGSVKWMITKPSIRTRWINMLDFVKFQLVTRYRHPFIYLTWSLHRHPFVNLLYWQLFKLRPYYFFCRFEGHQLYAIKIKGSAFLWHQVRCMVAVLFMIGQGLESPEVSIRCHSNCMVSSSLFDAFKPKCFTAEASLASWFGLHLL